MELEERGPFGNQGCWAVALYMDFMLKLLESSPKVIVLSEKNGLEGTNAKGEGGVKGPLE